jgi:hypothetical protein
MVGQWGQVSLPTYQQSLLNGMDRDLEARDPGLASMFAIFTRLTRDDGPPRTERLRSGWSSLAAALRRTRTSAAIPIILVIALLAAIFALGVATSSGSACRPAVAARTYAQPKSVGCQSAPYSVPK